LVNKVCSVALDQAIKGHGYPVCLFEAHEQAVIKSVDRDFFYTMLERMSHRQAKNYALSQKSIKKLQPLV
jgi:NurA-like 5'-3' nuclease